MDSSKYKAKTYQKPKANHPWRQYKNKPKEEIDELDEIIPQNNIIPVKEFMVDLVEHWDNYEVTLTVSFEGSNQHLLKTLPQNKAAAWIAGTLKRIYG